MDTAVVKLVVRLVVVTCLSMEVTSKDMCMLPKYAHLAGVDVPACNKTMA
jgi:hypothetical protein